MKTRNLKCIVCTKELVKGKRITCSKKCSAVYTEIYRYARSRLSRTEPVIMVSYYKGTKMKFNNTIQKEVQPKWKKNKKA